MSEEVQGQDKRDVELTVTSVTGGQTIRQRAQGTLFRKEGRYFYRYQEPGDQMGRTITIVRVDDDSIKIIRQGDVKAEQTFALGRTCGGYYTTPHGTLSLETKTRKLSVKLTDGLGSLEWAYDLSAGGEAAGRFSVTIGIKPAVPGQPGES